jgi:hypothetical protein
MRMFSHDFVLPLSPAGAMPLFTPKGEERWVPGWAPNYVDPPDGATGPGMIFSTGGGETWWTCLAWDPAGHARYLRLTPGHKVARVNVRCAAHPGGCTVTVTYEWIGLDDAGRSEVAAMTQAGFAQEIDGWRCLIGKALGV